MLTSLVRKISKVVWQEAFNEPQILKTNLLSVNIVICLYTSSGKCAFHENISCLFMTLKKPTTKTKATEHAAGVDTHGILNSCFYGES